MSIMKTVAAVIYLMVGLGVTAGIEKRLDKDFGFLDFVTSVAMWPATVSAFATYHLATLKNGGEA